MSKKLNHNSQQLSKKSNKNVCIFIVIVFVTKMFAYKGYPKSTYMLYHLDKKEQVDAWTDIYRNMKKIMQLGYLNSPKRRKG